MQGNSMLFCFKENWYDMTKNIIYIDKIAAKKKVGIDGWGWQV